ncbi:MAG: hypothetical protein QNJ68_19885 [Microcoleaceae cyanobacterium MO_207.B10]|nr:hypothetical protein [Microcoleaceae cyanobacterium MO_207.B10]
MFNSKKWRFGTSLLLTFGMTLATATPPLSKLAMAQYNRQRVYNQQRPYNNNQQRQFYTARVPAGTLISVEYEEAEKVILTPDESMSLELTVTREIRDVQGRVTIPAGSIIVGQLRPVNQGTQFFAEQVIIGNRRRFPINAISGIVTETETVRRGANGGDILKGAAVGAAAATLLSGILGDKVIATEKVLAGAGLGALAGVLLGREKAEVVVIYPEEDLDLRLRSDFTLSSAGYRNW